MDTKTILELAKEHIVAGDAHIDFSEFEKELISHKRECENCTSYVSRASFCKDLDKGVADDFYCSYWQLPSR